MKESTLTIKSYSPNMETGRQQVMITHERHKYISDGIEEIRQVNHKKTLNIEVYEKEELVHGEYYRAWLGLRPYGMPEIIKEITHTKAAKVATEKDYYFLFYVENNHIAQVFKKDLKSESGWKPIESAQLLLSALMHRR